MRSPRRSRPPWDKDVCQLREVVRKLAASVIWNHGVRTDPTDVTSVALTPVVTCVAPSPAVKFVALAPVATHAALAPQTLLQQHRPAIE